MYACMCMYVCMYRLPGPWDEGLYWDALQEVSEGEMAEFGEGGSFEDIIHALEVGR